jgi:hypothetical protein
VTDPYAPPPSDAPQPPQYGEQPPQYGAYATPPQAPPYEAAPQAPQYGAQPPQYGAQPPQYGAQPPQYGAAPSAPQYGAQPPQYGAQPPQYGGYGAPAPQYGYGQYPAAQTMQAQGTDGLAIAALITGILASIVGVILGIIALVRIRKSHRKGKGMAIAGIVIGGLWTIGGGAFAAWFYYDVTDAYAYGDSVILDAGYVQCNDGNMSSCDTLFQLAPAGSQYEQFGRTCGGRTDGSVDCATLPRD